MKTIKVKKKLFGLFYWAQTDREFINYDGDYGYSAVGIARTREDAIERARRHLEIEKARVQRRYDKEVVRI